MGGDRPVDFTPHGRTDDEVPTDIAKVSIAARSNALMARISTVYSAQETVNILSCGCTHCPSESEFYNLVESW